MPYLDLSPREIQTHTDELREINMKRQQPKRLDFYALMLLPLNIVVRLV